MFIDRTYELLSAEAHNRKRPRFDKLGMAAILRSVEMAVLLMMVEAADEG